MNTTSIADVAEQIVQDTVSAMVQPNAGECLACYVLRQLNTFGCDGSHRFSRAFRDLTAPRATSLEVRLASMGACCCDCEIYMNAYESAQRDWESRPQPPCCGVRLGSTQPCGNWVRIRRYY
ncbi:DUF2695 domain-containing protein [Leucobacter salsicius]|uniref:DUF2695 domain-containing protein n=1 Tax=Leucobacter salsicius TaxID=664638 RepID=UPI0012F97DB4